MKYFLKKILILVNTFLIFVFAVVFVSAEQNDSDHIMLADIPFIYGESDFMRRIEERSEGRVPVGLVLSGGSARAFAHIGVLRRMEELGIVPDFIVSNSMGSIVGLLYGAGFSPDQIAEIIQSTNISELFKVVMPVKGGIIDVSRFSGFLNSYIGDLDLNELIIPVLVICEDLKTKRQVQIAEGDFMKVMRAAYALPFYFDPVEFKDHLLIDGGISNLVPLSIAYKYSDKVIASTTFYKNPNLNLRNPITNINVALDIGKSRRGIYQIKKYNPLLIRCAVESFSFMEFDSLEEIQAAGYRSADDMRSELVNLDSSGISLDLAKRRDEIQIIIDKTLAEYRPLESISIIGPALLFKTELGIFQSPRSRHYLNEDLHFTGGVDFSYGIFSSSLTAGVGIRGPLLQLNKPFPVLDARVAVDITHYLRLDLDYSLRFNTVNDFSPNIFSSSDLYTGFEFVPFASEYFKIGLFGSGELSTDGINTISESLITTQLEFSADSSPGSEENLSFDLFGGGQISNTGSSFSLEYLAYFADISLSIPIPGTGGLLLWDLRGFTRRPITGNSVRYYLRDAMRSSVPSESYSDVNFGSTSIVLNPYGFRPAMAELFMFKEIKTAIFYDIGWFKQLVWSAGLSLSFDLSLIGLKPLGILAFACYDSFSNGFYGGAMFEIN